MMPGATKDSAYLHKYEILAQWRSGWDVDSGGGIWEIECFSPRVR
jgi:hypothetical protein